MHSARDLLIGTSRWLNERIRTLDAQIGAGGADPASIAAVRREAGEALERLRSAQGASGVIAETIPKVAEHVDLFVEIATSSGDVPALSRKLLRHLLEEQIELTALAEREGGPVKPASPGEDGRGGPGVALPGGRRALTVGSLIGR